MAVHAKVLDIFNRIRYRHLIFHFFVRFAFHQGIAAELARQHDQGPVQQPTLLQIQHKLSNGRVNRFLHIDQLFMPVLMRIPVEEWNVFRGNLDESSSRFGETTRKQTPKAKTPNRTLLIRTIAGLAALETLLKSVIPPVYLATFSFGSNARSNAFAAGELNRRCALSTD